jgi:pseudouridine kinase
VVVIGGANVDVKARSDATLVPATSNPGSAVLAAGGVGRNIAENLARLGSPVALVSAVGTDLLGGQLLKLTAAAGVDVSAVRRTPDHPTGTYTATLSPEGELALAVADMGAVDAIAPGDLQEELIAAAGLLVVDGNLAAPTIARALDLACVAGVPAILEPVSVPKAARLRAALGSPVHTVTPNAEELAALTAPELDVAGAAAALRERGVERVWVRLGASGSLLVAAEGTVRLEPVRTEVVDVTGAGDAMLAAYCHALLAGATPAEAAAYGQAAAALTVAVPETVRPDLTDDLVRSLL